MPPWRQPELARELILKAIFVIAIAFFYWLLTRI